MLLNNFVNVRYSIGPLLSGTCTNSRNEMFPTLFLSSTAISLMIISYFLIQRCVLNFRVSDEVLLEFAYLLDSIHLAVLIKFSCDSFSTLFSCFSCSFYISRSLLSLRIVPKACLCIALCFILYFYFLFCFYLLLLRMLYWIVYTLCGTTPWVWVLASLLLSPSLSPSLSSFLSFRAFELSSFRVFDFLSFWKFYFHQKGGCFRGYIVIPG